MFRSDSQTRRREMQTEPPKRGRPKKQIDLELVERLAHIQCTHAEIASALSVSVDTLTRNKQFAEVYKRGAEGGRKSLRRMQFESANRGNVVMQIWLGKQYLGQSDHVTSEIRRLPSIGEISAEDLNRLLSQYASEYPEIAVEAAALDASFTVVKPTRATPTQAVALLGPSDQVDPQQP
jgi:hypothetical protein